MSVPSKVSRLPFALRAEIEKLWRERRYTLDELLAALRNLAGASPQPVNLPSRTGLHNYFKRFDAQMENVRATQEIARVWIEKLGEDPQGDVARLAAMVLKQAALSAASALNEQGASVKPAEVMLAAAALKHLASAEATLADREIKIRKEIAQRVDKVIDAETKRGAGLSADAAERIRTALMGK